MLYVLVWLMSLGGTLSGLIIWHAPWWVWVCVAGLFILGTVAILFVLMGTWGDLNEDGYLVPYSPTGLEVFLLAVWTLLCPVTGLLMILVVLYVWGLEILDSHIDRLQISH